MLELTMGGLCMGGVDAVEFFESVPDMFSEAQKTEEFCEEYERALNRVRYEVGQSVAVAPKVQKAQYKKYSDFYNCGKCGYSLHSDTDKFCPHCGKRTGWNELAAGAKAREGGG